MPMETVPRRWRIATWLVAGARDHIESIATGLVSTELDVAMVQSIREHDAEQIAAAMGANHAWAASHHPKSRLIRGSAVGLAAITPHRITFEHDAVVGDQRSMWSRHRRIAQVVSIERVDHSAYTISHAVTPASVLSPPSGAAPLITVRPAQVGVDTARAIELPDGATRIEATTKRPIQGVAELLTVTFELPWVAGDFPVG